MSKGKNFFYRVNPHEVFSAVIFADNREQWFMQFFQELSNDDPNAAKIPLATKIITEAHEFRAKRSIAGKKSSEQRGNNAEHKGTYVEHMLNNAQPVAVAVTESKPKKKKGMISSQREGVQPYAEYVHMLPRELGSLVDRYGDSFTRVCIDKLNTYKGSKGKTYANDYLAICSWVVDEVTKTHRHLISGKEEPPF